jgi:hypothetical protein
LKVLEEYKDIKNINKMLELNGFTSTSLKKEEVLKYMFKCLSDEDAKSFEDAKYSHKRRKSSVDNSV